MEFLTTISGIPTTDASVYRCRPMCNRGIMRFAMSPVQATRPSPWILRSSEDAQWRKKRLKTLGGHPAAIRRARQWRQRRCGSIQFSWVIFYADRRTTAAVTGCQEGRAQDFGLMYPQDLTNFPVVFVCSVWEGSPRWMRKRLKVWREDLSK